MNRLLRPASLGLASLIALASAGAVSAERYGRRAPASARVQALLPALASASEPEAVRASEELVGLGRRALPGLLAALGSGPERTRERIVGVLGQLEDERVGPALGGVALEDPSVLVRWHALGVLSSQPERRTGLVPEWLEALEAPGDQRRWNAALALSTAGRLEAVAPLHAALRSQDPWRRWEAVNALRRVNDQDTARQLAALVVQSPSARLRGEAVLTVGALPGDDPLRVLLRALEDEDAGVRWRACAALGRRADERTLRPLMDLHERETDRRVREEAREAIARISGLG
jgi:HEAT repeat protein